jgi:Uncharacterised nucleotidyltransferase
VIGATRAARGRLIARLLSGAWRAAPPPLEMAVEDVREIQPLLLRAGAAGLAWSRVRGTPLEAALADGPLHEAHRYQTLASLVRESRLAEVIRLLRAAGVEAVLGKGWAVARLYPEAGRRPCGDIDLYVRRRDHPAAERALRGEAGEQVDLHCGFAELDDRVEEDLLARSKLVAAGGVEVRLFGPEDHLRLLALHTLRHGVLRSLWLCDVALAVESAAGAFDWDWFAAGQPRRTDWAFVALEIAHAILGASLEAVPLARGRRLPAWLVPAVLSEWGAGRVLQGARTPVAGLLGRPAALARALILRWPNGIEATVGLGRPFGGLPRLPMQIGECVRRTGVFALRATAGPANAKDLR